MKPKQKNNNHMGNIVYTTAISKEITSAYNHYKACLDKKSLSNTKENEVKANAAFIAFANACEKENKTILNVIDSLKN